MAKTKSLTETAVAVLGPITKLSKTLPILQHVHVFERDGRMIGQATDLDIVVEVPVNNDLEPGMYAILGKELVLSTLKTENFPNIYVKGMGKKIINEWSEELKKHIEKEVEAEVGTNEMTWKGDKGGIFLPIETINRIIPFISKEESRYTLNGALLRSSGDTITFCSTDGHRLIAETSKELHDVAKGDYLIPSAVLKLAAKYGKAHGGVYLKISSDKHKPFRFYAGEIECMSRNLNGQFPNFEAVMPMEAHLQVSMTNTELLAALKDVKPFTDERSGTVKIEDKGGYFELTGTRESYSKTVKVPYIPSVEVKRTNPKAILAEENSFFVVLMPMRAFDQVRVPVLDDNNNPVIGEDGKPVVKMRDPKDKFAFNVDYLIDICKVNTTNRLHLAWKDASYPFAFSPVDFSTGQITEPVVEAVEEQELAAA